MFKVITKTPDVELPEDNIYYIVAKNGTFIHKKTLFIEAIVPVKGMPWLVDQKKEARIFLPKIPLSLLATSLNFFGEVYRTHRAEAITLLHYSPEENKYLINAPEQEVNGASVDYVSDDRFDGYQLVGTIHNHSNFGAFHSGTDDADEKHFDGIHITTGNILDEFPTISVSIVVNGTRFTLEPNKMMEGIELLNQTSEEEKEETNKWGDNYYSNYRNQNAIKDKKFQLIFPGGKALNDYPFDPLWMDLVSKARVIIIQGYQGYQQGKKLSKKERKRLKRLNKQNRGDYLNPDYIDDPYLLNV